MRRLHDDALPVRLYQRTLVILPRAFRRRYAAGMVAMLADEWRERRGLARGALMARALFDLLRTAAIERISGPGGRHEKDPGMRASKTGGVSWLDVKLGLRLLIKHPGLTLVGGLSIAFGIALGAAYFEVANNFFDPKLPLDGGDRIVGVRNWDLAAAEPGLRSLHDFQVWREELGPVEDLGAFRTIERNLAVENGGAAPATGAEISASAFRVTGVPAMLGRTLLADDQEPGAPPVVLLGYGLWRSRFAGDADIVGRTVQLDGSPSTVVGIMPEGYAFPVSHGFWVPFRLSARHYDLGQGPEIQVFGRLVPGATLEEAQAKLAAIGQRASVESPETHEHLRPRIMPYTELFSGADTGRDLYVAQAILLMVLLVICANVGTLVFARMATRDDEIAVRQALGASRGRVLVQLFVESLVLALAAAAIGLAVVSWGMGRVMNLLWIVLGGQAPFWWSDSMAPSTVLYAGALAVLAAVVARIVPALKATRPHVQARLRQAAVGGGSGPRFGGMWTGMIITQVTFSVLIVPGAIAGVWGWIQVESADPGFPAEQYLSVRLEMDRDQATSDAGVNPGFLSRFEATYRELGRRMAAEPNVSAVTFADRLPGMDHDRSRVEVDGVPAPPASTLGHRIQTASVDASFFEVLRAPILAGRAFTGSDHGAVIVNQAFVSQVLGDRNAIGRRVRYATLPDEEPGPWYEIVGVVKDLGMDPSRDPLTQGTPAGLYHPLTAGPAPPGGIYPVRMAVQVQGDPGSLAPRVRRIATALDPTLRLYDLLPLDEPVDEVSRAQRVLNNSIDSGFVVLALIALIISAAGTYALMSFTVSRRTREIGIRVALGATPRRILTATFSRGLVQVGLGIVVGATIHGLAILLGSTVSDQTAMRELALVLGVAIVMMVVGLLACGMPARRALRMSPTMALR